MNDAAQNEADEKRAGTAADTDLFGRRPKGKRDWSHRRAEPRGLLAIWMLYLCATALIALGPLTFSGPHGPTAFRPATRLLLVLLAVGVAVLYPLIRLSQEADPRPVRAALRDLIVLLAPASVVVITAAARLAMWPLEVSLAAIGVLTAWSLVSVGLTKLATAGLGRRGSPVWRGTAALACVGATLGGLLLADPTLRAPGARSPVSQTPTPGWMASAPGAMYEVVRDRAWTGRFAAVAPGHWHAIAVAAGGGVAALALAGGLARLGGSSPSRKPASVADGPRSKAARGFQRGLDSSDTGADDGIHHAG